MAKHKWAVLRKKETSEIKSRLLHGCMKLEKYRNTWQEWKHKRCEASKGWGKACSPSCLNTPILSEASATTSLPRESNSLLSLLAVWWYHVRSPRLHPQLWMRLCSCSPGWCWKAGNNYYLSFLAQGHFSRLVACFLFLKVNSLSSMPKRQRKEITKGN